MDREKTDRSNADILKIAVGWPHQDRLAACETIKKSAGRSLAFT
jgi:hypothetical protein